MEIENTPIYKEIIDVIRTNDKETQMGWSAIIHLDDQGNIYTPLQVTSLNIKRDYLDNYADEMSCTVLMPLGKYAHKVYPNRNHLQISLQRLPLKEGSVEIDLDKDIETERYSATLIETLPAMVEGQGQETKDEYALDLVELVEIHFQLFNKSIEKIRMVNVGGIVRHATVEALLKTLLTNESVKFKVDNKRVIEGVEIFPSNNQKTYEQLVISQGTKLVDFVKTVQGKYGVYSAGIGDYIQNKTWYVYPLYDTGKFEQRKRTLTIYILPKKKFPEIERTYRKKGDSLIILSTSDTSFQGDNKVKYLNEGNGVRIADSSTMLEDFGKTKNNKTVLPRGKNNTEIIAEQTDDGLNNAPMGGDRITSNPYKHYSNLSGRKGGVFKIVWHNSSPNLIEPGMITRIIYLSGDEIKEAYGTVLGATHISSKVGDIKMKKHVNTSTLAIFTNLKTDS